VGIALKIFLSLACHYSFHGRFFFQIQCSVLFFIPVPVTHLHGSSAGINLKVLRIINLGFLQIRQDKKWQKVNFVPRSCLLFAKDCNCCLFIILFDILQQQKVVRPIIRPDIRYPAFGYGGYPAGRQKQFPVHP
jgi:hypothetical protein